MASRRSYSKFEDASNRQVCELEKVYESQNSTIFDKRFEKAHCESISGGMPPLYGTHETCLVKPSGNHTIPNWKVGYDCLDGSQYLQPDRLNTFHNYLVLQEDGMRCTENHQVFNNWTKRKTPSLPRELEAAPPLPPLMPQQPMCDVFAALSKPEPYTC